MAIKQKSKKLNNKLRKRYQRQQQKNLSRKNTNTVRLLQYEITYEPIKNPITENLPLDVRKEFEEIYHLVHEQPKKAIPRLKELLEEYPQVRMLYNFLTAAYSRVSEEAKRDEVTMELYQKHPDYLFAKIQYAELCLRNGELKEIPAIFNNKFDLQALYPDRKVFHISEALFFIGFMGEYFCQKSDFQQAEMYLNLLKKLDPDDMRTRSLEKNLILLAIIKKTTNDLGTGIK